MRWCAFTKCNFGFVMPKKKKNTIEPHEQKPKENIDKKTKTDCASIFDKIECFVSLKLSRTYGKQALCGETLHHLLLL